MAKAVGPESEPIIMENVSPYYRPEVATRIADSPILWVNPTASPHSVRHNGCLSRGPCAFDSGAVMPEGTYMIQGLPPGRYPYHCELHPIMRGELIVKDDLASLSPQGQK
ncbi:MAG: hypothetical protein ACE5NA_03455 [Nitrospiraceae bacterium]